MDKQNELRVWWIPQVPMNPFHVPVKTVAEGALVLQVLAFYDLFQLKNRIKGDFANTGGLEVFNDGDWEEWEDEEADGIDAYIENSDLAKIPEYWRKLQTKIPA